MHATKAVVKLKPEINSGLNEIRTHDICDTRAVFYQASYQEKWELVTLLIRVNKFVIYIIIIIIIIILIIIIAFICLIV